MKPLIEQIVDADLTDRVVNERQLQKLVGGSDARRYGLVNRALKDGSLIRLKRGAYLLAPQYRSQPVHPFAVAQALLPGSYISFETALSHHGWIPEAVFTTASVTPGRKTIVYGETAVGRFSFHPLAIRDYQLLTAVDRLKVGALTAFVARPLRALMDLVALRKQPWTGIDWLTQGMRIEDAQLASLRRSDFSALARVYKHKATNGFLHAFEEALCGTKPSERKRTDRD